MSATGPARRILLVRLSAIGDIVFASALVGAFRAAYPHAHLAWLVRAGLSPLVAFHPELDQVIEWPETRFKTLAAERRWSELRREFGAAVGALRSERFDLAVDLQGLLKSAVPVRSTGAGQRIGLDSREGSALLMTRVIRSQRPDPRIGSEYLDLAQALQLPAEHLRMKVHPGPAAQARADELIREAGVTQGFAVFCPFTTRAQKHWFEDRWAALARRMMAEPGCPGSPPLVPMLLGGPGDRIAAGRIAAALGRRSGPAMDAWVGATNLAEAAALIERAALVIGVDTGLSHMGIAAARPTVLLFGSTRPYLDTGRRDAQVLYHPRSCSPCRRRPICDGRFDCMRDIALDEVLRCAEKVMDAGGRCKA